MKFLRALIWLSCAFPSTALVIDGQEFTIRANKRANDGLTSVVSWDSHSVFVRGERVMIYGGEVHPFRLPVPGLWTDIFQKIRALGFNAVSFYVLWAVLEGKPGDFSAEGVFALDQFFAAASDSGIYLIARPGPYINAESYGGGFPGWVARLKAELRTRDPEWLAATDNYAHNIASIIAKAQITNGGPVILYQPENEYTGAINSKYPFPDGVYMQYVEDQARNAGIVVPFINNDAWWGGKNAPGTGAGAVNIYGHDGYFLFDGTNPTVWPANTLPTQWYNYHMNTSPGTPYAIPEYQGGLSDAWGGIGYEPCAELINNEQVRVFHKNALSFSVKILSIYMTYGGTNWGNLGYSGGYTSYDFAAAITENRMIRREKYSETKLIANFLRVSSAYLTAIPDTLSTKYTSTADLTTTPLFDRLSSTGFWIVRQTDYSSKASTKYTLTVNTTAGTLTLPQAGGSLILNGRDSKIHVTDYDVGGTTLLYSTAEIFTWQKFSNKTVLVVYGGLGEHHELAIQSTSSAKTIEGSGVTTKTINGTLVFSWDTTELRNIVQVGSLQIYILDRNSAYDYWVPHLSTSSSDNVYASNSSLIVKAGYLLRTAYVNGPALHITGDFNTTTEVEVIGADSVSGVRSLHINNKSVPFTTNAAGAWVTTIKYTAPKLSVPDLSSLNWKYVDSLPEIQSTYDDSSWTVPNIPYTNNTVRNLTTPVSLYASDYGYNTGTLIYRGHFTALGNETSFYVNTKGGSGFGHTVWIGSTFLGSWHGDSNSDWNSTYALPVLSAGQKYIFTVLIDSLGMDENWNVGPDLMKSPRGILDYALGHRPYSAITWKLTGNLGGENYNDRTRGPLNEGGMYAERQGWHLPYAPNRSWKTANPMDGLKAPGIGFYQAEMDLDLPTADYDIPLVFNIGDGFFAQPSANYRVQLFVNGYQFGKYISNLGPQTSFPVPQGILNFNGKNWIAVTLWALDAGGAKLSPFTLSVDSHGPPPMSSLGTIKMSPVTNWVARSGAY